MSKDTTHLIALIARLGHEKSRLASAKTESERAIRSVWVAQIEKEIADEEKFLGLPKIDAEISDDELLAELMEI